MTKKNPLTRAKHKRAWDLFEANEPLLAKPIYQQICAKDRRDFQAWYILGLVEAQLGEIAQSELALLTAAKLEPSHFGVNQNLGLFYSQQGDFQKSLQFLEAARAASPDNADCLSSLAETYAGLERYAEAETSYLAAISADPTNGIALENYALLLTYQGRVEEAAKFNERAVFASPGEANTHSNLLLNLHYLSDQDNNSIFKAHQQWAKIHADKLPAATQDKSEPLAGRKIRIGYVTPDLREHSVAYFLRPLLANHDRSRFSVHCYSEQRSYDSTTSELSQYFDDVQNTLDLSDSAVVQRIQQDRIDILVDLAGHTGGNRLLVFACRAAPIQISYLGYPNTTGVRNIDYRLTDARADPEGMTEHFYTEELLRLPSGFLCFSPPDESGEVSSLPATRNGYVTFGSFNALAKIPPRILELWTRLMQNSPNARLIIKTRQLSDSASRKRIVDFLSAQRLDLDRVELIGYTSKQDHLRVYDRVDIALDSFPYHGTTTTCDTLWMGVPVVTIAGDSHVSRVGVSLLSQVGLAELVAKDEDEFLDCVQGLANDLPRLAEIRSNLRPTMSSCSLCDGKQFTKQVESLYQSLCERHFLD